MTQIPIIYDAYGAPLERKASRAGPIMFFQRQGQPVWSERDYTTFAREAYQQNVIAYRCIRLKAEAVAALPWTVFDGDEHHIEHDLLDLLRKPNRDDTDTDLFEKICGFLDISGNAYIEAAGVDEGGAAQELFVLRSDRMKMIPNARGYADRYEYSAGGKTVQWKMSDDPDDQQPILHIRLFHPTNDAYGMSAIDPAAFSIDIHNEASAFQKAHLANGATPSGAMVYKGSDDSGQNMPQEMFDRLKAEMQDAYQGANNAGRPLVLDGGIEWVEMGKSLKDLDFVNGKREMAREIALGFGVPPMLLGLPGDNTYANYREANMAFFRQTILPLADRLRKALSKFLAPTFGETITLAYDIDQIPALESEREGNWKKVSMANWLTQEEKREATGYPADIPEGHTPIAPGATRQGDRGEDRDLRAPRALGVVGSAA